MSEAAAADAVGEVEPADHFRIYLGGAPGRPHTEELIGGLEVIPRQVVEYRGSRLADSSPEQLRRRMLHGNIYSGEKISQGLTHFFRTGNLIALRELALRFVADESDEELLEHLRRRQPPVFGRRLSASWRQSPRPQGRTRCCGGRPASRCGSGENWTWSTSPSATPPCPGTLLSAERTVVLLHGLVLRERA